MKFIFVLVSIFIPAAASAQSPPMVGGKPLLVVKPQPMPAQPIVPRLRACLSIDDMTKERLDCYDAVVPPQPKRPAPAAKQVVDCRFLVEEDERLLCFNRFLQPVVARAPTIPATRILAPKITAAPVVHRAHIKRGRGGCGSRGGAGYRLPNGKCASRRR